MQTVILGQANELSSETIAHSARGTALAQGDGTAPPEGMTATSPPMSNFDGQAQVVQADSVRSEALIVKIASTNRQQVSSAFGGLRTNFSGFFAQSSVGVQRFIANKKAEISAGAAGIVRSVQAMVANAASAAKLTAYRVRETIDTTVRSVAHSVEVKVQGITDRIVGMINHLPGLGVPGAAQLRAAAAMILRRSAFAVTTGLSRVSGLISSALAAGVTLIESIIGAAHRLAGAAISPVGSAVQRMLQVAYQTLSRAAVSIITALRGAFNSTILPMVNRLENLIQQSIGRAQQQAISAVRTNRDQYSQAVSSSAQPSKEAGSDEIAREALNNNRRIVQSFQERSSAVIGLILQRMTAAMSQTLAHITTAVAQASQQIGRLVRQAIQSLGRIVQAVSDFMQSVVRALTDALSKAAGYVRSLIQNPVDQLLRFSEGALSRMADLVGRMVRSLVDAITSSVHAQETSQFVPTPSPNPAPAFLAPPLPIIIVVLAAIIAFFGGSVIVIGGTVAIIIGDTVIFVSMTVVVIVLVVLALLLLLLIIYLVYKLTKKKRPEKIISKAVEVLPAPRTRTSVGVGEEVELTYTGGNTTWSTTGGKLSALTGPTVFLTAPDTAQSITVTAGSATISFSVIAPSRVFMERRGAMQHTKDLPDSGIRLRPFLLPDTVNFYNVIYREMDVPFVATPGVYSCNPFRRGHCNAGGGGAPCPDLFVTTKVIAGKGTETVGDDCAYSGHCGTAPPFNPPYSPGSVLGSIPHEYKIGGGAYHSFAPVLQRHNLAADRSTLTTEKDVAKGQIKVTDNSSSNGCP